MSFSSKKTLSNIIAGFVVGIAYVIYALGDRAPAPDDIAAWAVLMLVFIGIGIGAVIVGQVLLHIGLAVSVNSKEKDKKAAERVIHSTALEDERDEAIGLKSSRVGYSVAGTGFIAALIALAAGGSFVLALHILFGANFLGSLIEGCVSISHFERGMGNG